MALKDKTHTWGTKKWRRYVTRRLQEHDIRFAEHNVLLERIRQGGFSLRLRELVAEAAKTAQDTADRLERRIEGLAESLNADRDRHNGNYKVLTTADSGISARVRDLEEPVIDIDNLDEDLDIDLSTDRPEEEDDDVETEEPIPTTAGGEAPDSGDRASRPTSTRQRNRDRATRPRLAAPGDSSEVDEDD